MVFKFLKVSADAMESWDGHEEFHLWRGKLNERFFKDKLPKLQVPAYILCLFMQNSKIQTKKPGGLQ